jgi:ABC-2 type transport system permease protein
MIGAARVVLGEAHKGILLTWYYKFNVLIQLLTLSTIFLFILYVLGQGKLDSSQLSASVLGYVVWFYAVNLITMVGIDLISEAQTGTLEQMYMSVVRPEFVLAGRALSSLASTTVLVIGFDIGIYLIHGTTVPMSWSGVVVLLITLAGLFGFGLALAGATLRFKNVQALANLVINMFIFMNGTLLAVSHFPRWLQVIANSLPSTQGITLLRSTVLDGRSLGSAWSHGALGGLLVNTMVYLVLGSVLFTVGARLARRRGSLGQY